MNYKNILTFGWFTLFTSGSTLICCALPIILITFGMGATVAALTSTFPFLIFLSKYKIWVFIFSGLMLALSSWFIYRPNQHCPTETNPAQICNSTKKWNKTIYQFSIFIWGTGFFAAFLALPLRKALGL